MPMSPPMPARTRRKACPPATRRREAGGKRDGSAGLRMSSIAGVTRNSIVELIVIVAVALGLALGIQAFIIKPYRIPSGSMEPTLTIGQRVLVDRIGTHFSEPHVGEIAVFPSSEGSSEGGVRADAAHRQARRSGLLGTGTGGVERELHQAGRRGPRRRRSTSRKATSIARPPARARSSASRTPTSANADRARSATSRRRSRFRPDTGS